MSSEELKKRTKKFSLDIIEFYNLLPKTNLGKVIGNQLLRSATYVGANYMEACRAKSSADFIYKIKIIEEEADESLYWLELIEESELANKELLNPLLKEADELTAIFTSIGKTLKNKSKIQCPNGYEIELSRNFGSGL
ncbi:MAG: four helix bundle protein [Bacteroidetes bacterium]|nr:four helix bundle protein [Bacteroidota bacterium]